MQKLTVLLVVIFVLVAITIDSAMAQMAGDANSDSVVDIGDVVYEINYLFKNGAPPVFYECGDPNADCLINVGDVLCLVNYLFKLGADPQIVECGWSEPVNLGPPINSPGGEEYFRMTPDGKMAVLVSGRAGSHGNYDIWYSFRDSITGFWSTPVNCGPNVNTGASDMGPCLSLDGKKLYCSQFERPGGYGGWDIWVSCWDSLNNQWAVPSNLGPTINSDGIEGSPFVSPDGNKLYFRNDWGIWVSNWNDSTWDTPVWLDTFVNVWLTERDPTVTADNKTLYFTRDYYTWQICVSHWLGTRWGSPEVLGPQINDPEGAMQPYITPDGSKLYFISRRPGGMGVSDVWGSEKIPVKRDHAHK